MNKGSVGNTVLDVLSFLAVLLFLNYVFRFWIAVILCLTGAGIALAVRQVLRSRRKQREEAPVIETEQGVFCLARKDIELKSFPPLPGCEGAAEGSLARYALPLPVSDVRLNVRPRMVMSDLYREYELTLEGNVTGDDVFLTVDYEGDQAELLLEGRKVADDYYRGEPWEIGLKRWDFPKKLLLRIFALPQGAPVFTDEPLTYENGRALRLKAVTAQEEFRVRLCPETLAVNKR